MSWSLYVTAIFLKNDIIFAMMSWRSKFYAYVYLWYWIVRYLSQVGYVTKTSYDIILVKYWPKNSQILESDFGKPQTWETSRYLSNLKFSEVICE